MARRASWPSLLIVLRPAGRRCAPSAAGSAGPAAGHDRCRRSPRRWPRRDLEGDVNVARKPARARRARARPARCAARASSTSCALARRGPVVLAFFAARRARAASTSSTCSTASRARLPGVAVRRRRDPRRPRDLRRLVRAPRLALPGRLGPRRRAGQPLRRRRLPAPDLRATRAAGCSGTALGELDAARRWRGALRRASSAPEARPRMSDGPRAGAGSPPGVAAELPGAAAVPRPTRPRAPRAQPAGVRERLALLSDRFRGAQALELRREAVPARLPRLLPPRRARPRRRPPAGRGGDARPADARRLPVGSRLPTTRCCSRWWRPACRCGRSTPPRSTARSACARRRAGERLGEGELAAAARRAGWCVADARGPVAVLFGDVAPERAPRPATRPRCACSRCASPASREVHVEEALWTCAEALSTAPRRR